MSILTDILYFLIAVLTSPLWGYRMMRTGKWRTDWAGRFGKLNTAQLTRLAEPHTKSVLIHAVSVGEVNATRQLINQLQQQHGKQLQIIISVTTDTGTKRANELFGGTCIIVRYPLDFSFAVARFLRAVNPDLVVLIELEVWPGFVKQCTKRNIPVIVINGRLSARSYTRYLNIRFLIKNAFNRLTHVCVQDKAYAARFEGLGAVKNHIEVTGTMKWDTAVIEDQVDSAITLAAEMGIDLNRGLIVCGSTGPGEEELMFNALNGLEDGRGPVQLLFAPRKPERFEHAFEVLKEPTRRTLNPAGSEPNPNPANVFLLDTIGELRKAYSLADVAIVGRSFCPLYGSDMIEPISLGCPTIIGPNTGDFQDSMDKLLAGEGIIQLNDDSDLRQTVEHLLNSDTATELAERGRTVIRQQQGATAKHIQIMNKYLEIDSDKTMPDAS